MTTNENTQSAPVTLKALCADHIRIKTTFDRTGTMQKPEGFKPDSFAWSVTLERVEKVQISNDIETDKVLASMTVPYFCGSGHVAYDQKRKPSDVEIGKEEKTGHNYGKRKFAVAPDAPGVLESLILDSSACQETFADWCGNFGYSEDSRKALALYLRCQEIGRDVQKLLGPMFEQFRNAET